VDEGINALMKAFDKAAAGDKSTLPAIREALVKNPQLADAFGGNLARVAIDSFIDNLSGKNLAFRESILAKLRSLRADLSGPNPSAIEQLLVERVVACWLQVYDADIRYAQSENSTFAQANFQQRRMTSAHKRYMSALRTLATVRKMAIPAVQINIA